MLTASKDKTICLWDVKTGNPVEIWDAHSDQIFGLAASPNDTHFASAGKDETIKIWDVRKIESGLPDNAPTPIRILKGHFSEVWDVNFSPDGKLLGSASEDQSVRIWNVKSGVELARLSGHIRDVFSLAFSSDNKHLAYGPMDNRVRLLDYLNPKKIELLGHEGDGLAVEFSNDGKYLVSGSNDGHVRIWIADSVYTGEKTEWAKLKKHGEKVRSVKFSHYNRLLASGASDKTIRLWQVDSTNNDWSIKHTLEGHNDGLWSVAFSPDDQKLASASWDGTIRL